MKVILIIGGLIIILYPILERRWDKKRAYKTYRNRVKKINKIREQEYANAGMLDKYKPLRNY